MSDHSPRDTAIRRFRATVLAGCAANLVLGGAGMLFPGFTLRLLGFGTATPDMWVRVACLLLTLLTFHYIPGALDPLRYRPTAILAVVARGFGVLFFPPMILIHHFEARFLIFSAYDFIFGLPAAIFLYAALRPSSASA